MLSVIVATVSMQSKDSSKLELEEASVQKCNNIVYYMLLLACYRYIE